MSIALVTMVKNEAAILPRLLRSVEGVCKLLLFVDTGSTDGTLDVLREHLLDHDGELHQDPWQDFGANRSLLIARGRGKADWLITLDADHELEGEIPALDPSVMGYRLAARGGDQDGLWEPRLLRGAVPWRYWGRTHEEVFPDDPAVESVEFVELRGVRLLDHADGSNRRYKAERDLALQLMDLADAPADPRTTMYVALTLDRLGEVHRSPGLREAARDFYGRRAAMPGGWDVERRVAQARIDGGSFRDAIATFKRAAAP